MNKINNKINNKIHNRIHNMHNNHGLFYELFFCMFLLLNIGNAYSTISTSTSTCPRRLNNHHGIKDGRRRAVTKESILKWRSERDSERDKVECNKCNKDNTCDAHITINELKNELKDELKKTQETHSIINIDYVNKLFDPFLNRNSETIDYADDFNIRYLILLSILDLFEDDLTLIDSIEDNRKVLLKFLSNHIQKEKHHIEHYSIQHLQRKRLKQIRKIVERIGQKILDIT
ncbi:MAG: hypothetical protein US69_C0005G0043 [candidate division TM6 bacterium GW2011_GWF2_38_10]|nr:MAG: hypothetical protein US69_C0005G0043 [candidate division TM6 bacterium GW2011_GWF2_38_10]